MREQNDENLTYEVVEYYNNDVLEVTPFLELEEAEKYFKTFLQEDYMGEDCENWIIELREIDEDGEEVGDPLESQILVNSGYTDRCGGFGECGVEYYFKCFWSKRKKELIYEMYFHGEITYITETKLNNWYYSKNACEIEI